MTAALLLGGCGWDEPDGPPPLLRGTKRTLAPAAAEKTEPAPKPGQGTWLTDKNSKSPVPVIKGPLEPAEEEKKQERKYDEELKRMLGSPLSCLEQRAAGEKAPDKIVISFDAMVMASGGVSRGSVRGLGLRSGEIKCLRQRLERQRLKPPIEGAPRRVTTNITLELQKAPPKPSKDVPAKPTRGY